MSIFEIDQSFIKSVDDKIARELVARLCRAELRRQSIPESAVTWGGDQRAKDGGVDVRVDCIGPLPTPEFVKTKRSLFQVKAEKFPPSKIQKEMVPHGTLRPAILELKETGGSYIIVSTQDDVSDEALQLRHNAILNCLSDHGLDSCIQFDFYDSRRIADWVELHPAITTWLRNKIGQPLASWRPYGCWAYGEDDPEAEYLVDDRLRVFVPNAEEGSSIPEAISWLRRELQDSVSIRIVGLSGVGKTSLVQALFDDRVCSGSVAPSSENVIYVDLADEHEPQPQTMLEILQERRSDSIVIVDNCAPDTHERLTRIIKRKGSLLKLITIEYDIRDDLPEDTICYRLEGSSSEIITKLVKARYQKLSDCDAERIAEFSDGNARVAFALASTAATGGELSRLRSQDLFERLFRQKKVPNDELLHCAEAASLIYSFDGVDLSPEGEIARLACFAEVTTLNFLRQMAELKRRGLLQERSQWRAVLPQAIANRLAKRLLESVPGTHLYEALIEQGGKRIPRSFTRRLGFLHDCPKAVAIASRMLDAEGKLGDLTALTAFEQQMFFNLAPLDPKGALDALKRATKKNDFLSVDNRDRMAFARVARSIAYEPAYLEDAVLILKRFALAETKSYTRSLVRDILKSLFYCHLSGTQAEPEQRRKVVECLVLSCNENERELGLDLIRAGLETQHFSSHYRFEFGARRRDYGWHPQSQADVKTWFRCWIDLVGAIGEKDNPYGREARMILGDALRGLWGRVGLDDELVDVAKRLSAIDGWPEGWLGVRLVLQWDVSSLSPASIALLRKLDKMLLPSDLASEIRALILAPGSLADYIAEDTAFEGEGGDCKPQSTAERPRRGRVRAEILGIKAARSPELLVALIPDLCSTKYSGPVYEFGRGIGSHLREPGDLLEDVRTHIQSANQGDVCLIWVRGILSGWNENDSAAVDTFMDNAMMDVVWRDWFVELQVQLKLNEQAFGRLLRVLDSGYCPTWQFSYLAMGRATDPLTVAQIMTLTDNLAFRPDQGMCIAIDLLAMVIRWADDKDEQYKQALGKALLKFFGNIDWPMLNADHAQVKRDLHEVLGFALRSAETESEIAAILKRMLSPADTECILCDEVIEHALKPFFQYFPQLALQLVYNKDEDGTNHRASHLVTDPYSELPENTLGLVSAEVLIDWCNEEPETRYVFAAKACKLFEKPVDKKSPLMISDTAISLLKAAPDKKAFVAVLVSRFQPSSWVGSLAGIMEARLPLFDQLFVVEDEAASLAIKDAKERLIKQIKAERAREKEREKLRNSSFE